MALPLSERVSLAQALWESVDAGVPEVDERAAVSEAIRRDKELSSGDVAGHTDEEVMETAARARMRLIYHPDAEAELIEAAQYYERRIANVRRPVS